MHIQFPGKKNNEQHVDQLVDSFRTQFWLEKHQCLPYAFGDFVLSTLNMAYKSTCPQNNDYYSYTEKCPNILPTNVNYYFSTDAAAQFHLQSLLDRSPCLNSLIISSWPSSEVPIVKNTNASLRQLDLRWPSRWSCSLELNSEECNTFIHSPLAMQCEKLLIKVKNRESILDLVNGMGNLRILHIEYDVTLGL
ncbi:unnamed protein product, partial [Rotaria sp. Silwood2]